MKRAGCVWDRAFTIVEVLVAAAVLLVGITVIVSSFTMQLRHSSLTRDALMGHLVMENLVEEVLAHPYGRQAPSSWNSEPVQFDWVVEGRRVSNAYHRKVEIDPKLGNGSFFGKTTGPNDRVHLEVRWTTAAGTGSSAEDKSLSVELTVVRPI